MFKWNKNNYNRDGTVHWYICAERKSLGCPARAPMKRKEAIDEDTGEVKVVNHLIQVASCMTKKDLFRF